MAAMEVFSTRYVSCLMLKYLNNNLSKSLKHTLPCYILFKRNDYTSLRFILEQIFSNHSFKQYWKINIFKSRTPTQVASHAQKYFLRRTNLNCRRRRFSLFDITTKTVTGMYMEQDQVHHPQDVSSLPETNISSGHQFMQVFPEVAVPTRTENAPQTVPVTFQANPPFNAAIPAPLSLNLSLSFNLNEQSNSRHSAFTMMPSFSDRDSNSSSSSIRVA
ncbi:hypothetical protein Bca4012_025602 [Brassica carinata]|uniref:Uncharacterized protein n=1 Tax=Brassica carinata TaxID=52824 RepID=A0A8X7VH15_BRACI|nr:hypothetical protein Bca52824_022703 [Brassica carinata]